MFFVIDKPKFQRIVALIRDDRTPKAQADGGHFMRLEASLGQLKVAGPMVEASIPATVHEDGVLFLRVTRFRRLMATITGQKMLAFQVNCEGLFFEGVRLSLEANDMLLYPDPTTAPVLHPLDRLVEEEPDPITKALLAPPTPSLWNPKLPLFPDMRLPLPVPKKPRKRSDQ